MSRIIWLASYPKSGNTWFRVFLTNLQRESDEPAHINALESTTIASAREMFDNAVGYEAGDLTHEEVDRIRPQVYRYEAAAATEPQFRKVHDAYTYLPDGQPLFPPEVTAGAIYLIRNPLDVCVSFANHSGHDDFDRVIKQMGNPNFALCGRNDRQLNQLRQQLLSWGDHVMSWLEAPGIRVHVMRYEDMKTNPVETFTAAAAFAGLQHDRERVEGALAQSSFETLQQQDQEDGFNEKIWSDRLFFRKGTFGTWRDALTPEQAARLIADHEDVMRRFDYLTPAGEPVY